VVVGFEADVGLEVVVCCGEVVGCRVVVD